MKISKRVLLMTISLVFAGSVIAATAIKPEKQIKLRQSGFEFMAWNMGKIKTMTIDDPGSFNKDQVSAAANAISGIANSGMGALFGAGTEKSIGTYKTKVKPALFTQPDAVGKLMMDLRREATTLAKVSATGDVAAIKEQFGKTGATCKACHDKFRQE